MQTKLDLNSHRCPICGAPNGLQLKGNSYVCDYCKYERPIKAKHSEAFFDLQKAADDINKHIPNFDTAYEKYLQIIKKYPDCAEAYWGAVLAKYGIKIVDNNHNPKPTCYIRIASNVKKITEDNLYLKAIKHADESQQKLFQRIGEECDKNITAWAKYTESIDKKYDVFIAFCDHDPSTNKLTGDQQKARELYNYLSKKHLNVFFSPESMKYDSRSGTATQEQIIYDALMSANAMVVVATNIDYVLNSEWVRNEWSRFLYRKEHNLKAQLYLNAVIDRNNINIDLLPNNFKNESNLIFFDETDYKKKLLVQLKEHMTSIRKLTASERKFEKTSISKEMFKIEEINIKSSSDEEKPVVREIKKRTFHAVAMLEPNEKNLLDNGMDILSKNDKGLFNLAKKNFLEVLKSQKDNIDAKFGLFLINLNISSPKYLNTEILLSLSEQQIDDMFTFINYFKDVNDEFYLTFFSKIEKFVCETDYRNKNRQIILNNLESFRDDGTTVSIAEKLLYNIKVKATLPINNKFVNYLIAVTKIVPDKLYKKYLEQLIDICISKKAYVVAIKLLDEHKKYFKDSGFITKAALSIEHKSTNTKDMLISLLKSEQYKQIIDIVSISKNEDELEKNFEYMVGHISNYIRNQIFDSEKARKMIDFVFKYKFPNRDDQLNSKIIRPLIENSTRKGADLFEYVVFAYLSDSEADEVMNRKIKTLINSSNYKLALYLANENIKHNSNRIDPYYLRLKLRLKVIGDSFKNIEPQNLLSFTPKDDLKTIYSLSQNKDDLERYTDVLCDLINSCLRVVGFSNKLKDHCFVLIDFFLENFPPEEDDRFVPLLEKIAEKALQHSEFSRAKKYCDELTNISQPRVQYYLWLICAKCKCHNENELKNSPYPIEDFDEYKTILSIYQSDEGEKRIYNDKILAIVKAQSSIKFKKHFKED